ncbi:MAG: IclR family transcriptional regulator [Synergistaceae bacterium]|jgi:DNA-binding IclR family transcriptional regulator|nr:IclR family transcriptional regulator [Synergistaceae bacterium]
MRDPQSKLAPTQTNQSSDKLLNLLEILSEQIEPLRLRDIARLCGMNVSTTLRFLTALQRRGYVAQDAETARYYLTFKLCVLAQNLTTFFDVRGVALPFLRDVARAFSESCHLAIEDNMTVVYIEVVNANKTLMSTQHIGNVAPLHCTGVGKTFLADYSSAELERYIAVKKLPAYTEHTLTDPRELKSELERVRSAGYALDNQECEIGARCVAAPIRDYTGKTKAGLSVSGPAVRMTDDHIFAHLPFLLEAAARISARMGWTNWTKT